MAKNGLDKWFKQKWVDIGSKKKDGSLILPAHILEAYAFAYADG